MKTVDLRDFALSLNDGSSNPTLSGANSSRIRYNADLEMLESSKEGQAFESLDASGAEFGEVVGISGRFVTESNLWVTVGALNIDPTECRTTGRVLRCQALISTEDALADAELRFENITTSTTLATLTTSSATPVLQTIDVAIGANLLDAPNTILIHLRKSIAGDVNLNAVCDMARIKIDYS